jgi:RNA polymerase sigma-70 factor (ECF subfamily)
LTTVSDGELLRLVQTGSPEEAANAFGALFDHTNRRLEAFLARGLGVTQPEIVWVAEETWERALESLHTYEDRGRPFLAWLCRIATNVWHERRRQLGKHPPLPEGYEAAAVDAWSRDPLLQLAERDDRHDLEMALRETVAALKPDQRAVLERRLVLGKSSREVADELGWTIAKVDTTLHRARKACRTYLLERFGLGPATH